MSEETTVHGIRYAIKSDALLEDWIVKNNLPAPSCMLPTMHLCKELRKEYGWMSPFSYATIKHKYEGVYLFYDECNVGCTPFAIYAGHSDYLGIRLYQHWNDSRNGFNGDPYWDLVWEEEEEKGLTGVGICIAIWILHGKAKQVELEAGLIDRLHPLCNQDMNDTYS